MMPIIALVHLADRIIEVSGWREDLPRLLRPYAATADHIEVYEQREIIWDPKHVVAVLDACQRSGGSLSTGGIHDRGHRVWTSPQATASPLGLHDHVTHWWLDDGTPWTVRQQRREGPGTT